jgi:signal transduction histidine kinase
LEVEVCEVLHLLPDGSALTLVAGVGWRGGLVGQTVVGIGSASQAGYTLESGAPIVVDDLGTETRFRGPPLLHEHAIVSGISAAVGRPEMPWGILGAHSSRRRVFSKDDVNFVQSVAHLLGVAIARSEAEDASRDLALRLLCAEDAERRRIAKELHDSTAQDLVAAMLNLNCLRESASTRDSAEVKQVEDGLALLENCAHEIRTLAYVLHPPELDETGLAGAIQIYAAGFGERTGIGTRVEVPGDLDRLEGTAELVLFRVVQECLGNIHRHAHSLTASIRLRQEATVTELEIRDEGCGIPAQILDGKPGLHLGLGVGIRGMRERLKQLGGRLIIDSGPGGTTIRAIVPRGSGTA